MEAICVEREGNQTDLCAKDATYRVATASVVLPVLRAGCNMCCFGGTRFRSHLLQCCQSGLVAWMRWEKNFMAKKNSVCVFIGRLSNSGAFWETMFCAQLSIPLPRRDQWAVSWRFGHHDCSHGNAASWLANSRFVNAVVHRAGLM